MKPTILAMDGGHPGQYDALLRKEFNIVSVTPGQTLESIVAAHGQEIKGVSTFLTPVRKELIDRLPNLEIIASGSVGLDHIDLNHAWERGVKITNTAGVLTDDTADMAMALVLASARNIVEGNAHARNHWPGGPMRLGTSLKGKMLGIVGYGEIGKAVACRAAASKMKIVYNGPREKKDVPYPYYPDLKKMAADVDFLVLTCQGGEKTRHLINAEILNALGWKGRLINVARGSVVDEEALIQALEHGAIAGAGLDVFNNEPNIDHRLKKLGNVVLTPHIGSATRETRIAMGQLANENLEAHFIGQPLVTLVEPK